MTAEGMASAARRIMRNSTYGLAGADASAADWLSEPGGSYREYLLKRAAACEPPMDEEAWRGCAAIFGIRERQDFE